MSRYMLVYGEERIPYDVTEDPNRTSRVAIHVNPDGSVVVDAPKGQSEQAVKSAVQKWARWITRHVADARNRCAHVRPREYVSGEQVLYLGRRYVLKVALVDRQPGPVKMKGNRLVVETRTGDPEDVRGRLRGWYRVRARDYFANKLSSMCRGLEWIQEPPGFRLLDMSRQWGSCSSTGTIILNPNLIRAPRECVEYVLVHELAHLRYHDHGADFWALVSELDPNWQNNKKNLDALAEVILQE